MQHSSVRIKSAGQLSPLGMSVDETSPDSNDITVNFACYAPDVARLTVHFFAADTEEHVAQVEVLNRTGKVFHAQISNVHSAWSYSISTKQKDPIKGSAIDGKLLIDPYAKRLNSPLVWNEVKYQDNNPFMIPKSPVMMDVFDWQNVTKPKISQSQTILYELHVKGFTQNFPDIPPSKKGRYLALAEPSVIKYISSLGVTSVQLMPVFAYMTEPRLQELGLTNYWGYNPVNFFAPEPRYANDDAVTELKTAIRELHRAGIEVIVDVVFNHTAESGCDGPVLSFKGLVGNEFYLRSDDDYSFDYANYTGCGNTVNADSDFGLKIIMDSLRYWLEEMQVDGFRFDLAATLGRNGERFNRRSGLFRAMSQDPIVSQAKLIAEPWDIGPEGYQLGNFPAQWLECNDKYRDGVRKFWRGDLGLVPEMATRMLGSRDIFKKGKRSQVTSVNYIAYHDGFTLNDLVSYEQRVNDANLENNRDGHGANYSRNYGEEGTTRNQDIIEVRERQKRNFLATLFLSQGVPHLLAGDESSRTQQGNNNAYCQDNEISWLNWDWQTPQSKLFQFTQYLIQLRKQYSILQHCNLKDDGFEHNPNHHHVAWLRPDGEEKSVDDWQNPDNQCVGLLVADDDQQYQLLFILNASSSAHYYKLPEDVNKQRLLDTALDPNVAGETHASTIFTESNYTQPAQSLSLWKLS